MNIQIIDASFPTSDNSDSSQDLHEGMERRKQTKGKGERIGESLNFDHRRRIQRWKVTRMVSSNMTSKTQELEDIHNPGNLLKNQVAKLETLLKDFVARQKNWSPK